MSTEKLVQNAPATIADTIQTFYEAPISSNGVLITAFTVTNNSGVNASYKCYIDDGTTSIPLKPLQVVVWGTTDHGLGIVNQVVKPGHFIRISASAADSVYFNITGRVL